MPPPSSVQEREARRGGRGVAATACTVAGRGADATNRAAASAGAHVHTIRRYAPTMPLSNEELIARVRDNPVIWMSSHPLHMNRAVLRKFWVGLSEECQENESRLRKRWKHYKDQFRKEFKKAQERSLSDESVSWSYYESLSFLKEELIMKERNSSLMRSEAEETDEDDLPIKEIKGRDKNNKISQGRVVKKVVSNTKLNLILRRVKETKELVEDRLTDLHVQNRNDHDYLFLMSLMPSIKQLTDIQKLQFKSKINDWLLQEITLNTYGKNAENYVVTCIKEENC